MNYFGRIVVTMPLLKCAAAYMGQENVTGVFGPTYGPYMDTPYIPRSYTIDQIYSDPYMSPYEKAKAIHIIREAKGDGGLVAKHPILASALSVGLGYTGAKAFSNVIGALFGRLPVFTQRELSEKGISGKLISGTMD